MPPETARDKGAAVPAGQGTGCNVDALSTPTEDAVAVLGRSPSTHGLKGVRMGEIDKLIVTNLGALSKKYDDQSGIQQALDDLVLADGQKGLATMVIGLDDAHAMANLGAIAVKQMGDPVQTKVAVDGVFTALRPSYLMILGATDVVPQQPLENPSFTSEDPDQVVYSDLPYACDVAYGTRARDFIGPTRVVSRLPDVTGLSEPGYLEGLLSTAASWQAQQTPDGTGCLGISAAEFEGSTTLSLANLFSSPPKVHLSPSEGPGWSDLLLAKPVHFINCHGADSDCRFYGQRGRNYPVAHDSACVVNRLTEGTVAAVEACYGAQLYDPAGVGGVVGICNTYLTSGAYAFFGSSTIAYGGWNDNESADLLCQYFLRRVLEGCSIGEAALLARQDFIGSLPANEPVDPVSLKTLAQFCLLGDPSVHPFLPQGKLAVADYLNASQGELKYESAAAARMARRERSAAKGQELRQTTSVAHRPTEVPDTEATIAQILQSANVTNWGKPELKSFSVSLPESPGTAPSATASPSIVHVLTRRAKQEPAPFRSIELIVASEVNGQVTSWRRMVSR